MEIFHIFYLFFLKFKYPTKFFLYSIILCWKISLFFQLSILLQQYNKELLYSLINIGTQVEHRSAHLLKLFTDTASLGPEVVARYSQRWNISREISSLLEERRYNRHFATPF